MSSQSTVDRDERTVAVENASYRWAYLFLSYGLLLVVAYRSFANRENSWDLLALVVLGGAVGTVYQGSRRVLSRRWAALTLWALVAAAAVAAIGAWLRS
jgi:hypothetical protein